jgi:D-alanyl-D-alanine carboxypeptidase
VGPWYGVLKLKSSASFLFNIVLGLSAFIMVSASPAFARPEFAAITVDARTGQILFQDHEDSLRHPASLTKMMTLYVLFQDLKAGRISLSSQLHVSARAASMAPSKLHLTPGSTISVEEAIKAIVTKSANDVAATIAENLGGSESNYAARMTRVAHSIGMSHSTFVNASGLPNDAQYTTARDMATLGLRLMRDFPQYYPYFRVTAFSFHGRMIKTHNKLVQHYAGTDGIKTGYIANAGFNLVTSTKRGDKRLVGVVLGARSPATRERFMVAMFERNFSHAKDGATVAALAGSSVGIIDPLKSHPKTDVAMADPSVPAKADVADSELAQAAADAAQGEVDQSASEDDLADGSPTASTSSPKVLQATLDTEAGKPKKLPFAVISTSDQPPTLSAAMANTWNIQIGAFPDKAQADAKITMLRGKASAVLTGKPGFTMAIAKDGQKVFRARFAGFDATEAKKACSRLKRMGTSCLAIAPQG